MFPGSSPKKEVFFGDLGGFEPLQEWRGEDRVFILLLLCKEPGGWP
jgi:hypothetical protein